MEVVTIIDDLQKAGEVLNLPLFRHLSKITTASNVVKLRPSLINNLHIRELEVTEFRTQHQAFCDWIYGWNINNTSGNATSNEFINDGRASSKVDVDDFSVTKTVRQINFDVELERSEAEKLLKSFDGLSDNYFALVKRWNLELDGLSEARDGKITSQNVSHTVRGSSDKRHEIAMSRKSFVGTAKKDEMDPLEDVSAYVEEDDKPEKEADSTNNLFDLSSSPATKANVGTEHIYQFLDTVVDYTILSTTCALIALGLAEGLKKHDLYNAILFKLNSIATSFIKKTFLVFSDTLNVDFYDDPITTIEIRDATIFKTWLKKHAKFFENQASAFKTMSQIVNSVIENNMNENIEEEKPARVGTVGHRKVPKIYMKFQYLGRLLSSIDVFLFPNSIVAHKRGVKCMQYSHLNSSFWITGGYDGIIRIFDLNSQACYAQYVGHRSIITDIKVTKKDTHIISASFDRTIKIWNVQNAVCERTLIGHNEGITSVDLSADQRFIASSSMDTTCRIWDFQTGEVLAVIKKHTKWIKTIRFSPDTNYIATASIDHKVYIWDLKVVLHAKNMTYLRCIDAHQDAILSIATQKPNLLLTCCRDQTVRLFDYMTGAQLLSLNLNPSWACCVAFSSDGQLFAAGSFDNTVTLFRTKSGEKIRQLRIFNSGVLSIAFPDNDQYILCGTSDGFIQQIPL